MSIIRERCDMVMWSPSQTGGFPPGYSGFFSHGANEHD